MNFVEKVNDTIKRWGMLRRGDAVVVGVSGGADSVSLLRALHELAREWDLHLTVGHLHHGIRGASADEDAEFVRGLAGGLGVACVVERVDVPAIAKSEGGTLEEVARRERYAFFGRVAAGVRATRIGVGHTMDDNAETVLHRILRGTGIRGLGGIPPMRPLSRGSDVWVVRPLIEITRAEVLAYLESIGQGWRTDPTNLDLAYSRNRIRNIVLPQLEAECGPGVKESLNRLACAARNQYNVIETMARDLLARARRTDPVALLAIDRQALRGANPELQIEVLRLALEDAGVGELSYEQSRGLADMVAAATATEMSLPGGLLLRAEYDLLRLIDPRAAIHEEPREATLEVPGAAEFLGRRFSARLVDVAPGSLAEFVKNKTPDQEMVDADALQPPLIIRTRRPGDRFRPLGAPGTEKLQDFFVDAKVPAWRRDQVPILCDRGGIVWIAGFRIDHRVRITEHTRKAVLLEIRPANDLSARIE